MRYRLPRRGMLLTGGAALVAPFVWGTGSVKAQTDAARRCRFPPVSALEAETS